MKMTLLEKLLGETLHVVLLRTSAKNHKVEEGRDTEKGEGGGENQREEEKMRDR